MKDRTDWGDMLEKPRSPETEKQRQAPKTPREAAESASRPSTGRR
jgi:hypothetical protein